MQVAKTHVDARTIDGVAGFGGNPDALGFKEAR